MATVNVRKFVEYIRERAESTPDDKINHDGGWHNCAVGEFVAYEDVTVNEFTDELYTVCVEGANELALPPEFEKEFLSNDGFMRWFRHYHYGWTFYAVLEGARKLGEDYSDELREINPEYDVNTWKGLAAIMNDCTPLGEE